MRKFISKLFKSGWVRVYRSLVEWEFYKDSNTKSLFLHLILFAEYKGVNRGTYITTVRELAESTGLSVKIVRTSLKKLVDNNDISVVVKNKKTHIKLLSWDLYQVATKDAIYLYINTDWTKYYKMIHDYEINNHIEPTQDMLRQFKILCQKEPKETSVEN